MLIFQMKVNRLKFLIELVILKKIKLSDMYQDPMKNGVHCSVSQAQMEERLLMDIFNFILQKVQDNSFSKVMLVHLERLIFTIKAINQISSVSLKEKLMKRIQQFISPKFQLHHKVSKNSKRILLLITIQKLLMISLLLQQLPKNTVSYTLLQNSVLFIFMKLALVNKSTKLEFQLEQYLQLLEIMSMMDFWLLLKQVLSTEDLLIKGNWLIIY